VKNLLEARAAEDIQQRVLRLQPESARQWGSMNVAQALAHCTSGMLMAMGEIKPKPAGFPNNVLGRLIKPLVFGNDKPIRRNAPSFPELFTAEPTAADFERERARLMEAINSFVSKGEAGCSEHPHPFFGPLKPQQWAVLMYKHLDHHLRQFGV